MFTNALLHPHDITALIRDTEAHERALFSIAAASEAPAGGISKDKGNHASAYGTNNLPGASSATMQTRRGPRYRTAVAAVLGGDMMDRIRSADGAASEGGFGHRQGASKEHKVWSAVDFEVLLRGAEKLCAV